MRQSIFTWKNFFRSLVLTCVNLILFMILVKIIRVGYPARYYWVMTLVFFLPSFLLGKGNLEWKEVFLGFDIFKKK